LAFIIEGFMPPIAVFIPPAPAEPGEGGMPPRFMFRFMRFMLIPGMFIIPPPILSLDMLRGKPGGPIIPLPCPKPPPPPTFIPPIPPPPRFIPPPMRGLPGIPMLRPMLLRLTLGLGFELGG
jgi:hypothetical protein